MSDRPSVKVGNVKGLYSEALTAEIFNAIADLIPINTKDSTFLKAQDKVHAIISREFIDLRKVGK